MRINIRSAACLCDVKRDRVVADPAILVSLNGWRYKADRLEYYLDFTLADLGVKGGEVGAAYSREFGLEIVIEFWAPGPLSDAQLNALREEARVQLLDGMGESGFDVTVSGQEFVLFQCSEQPLELFQIEDRRQVPKASRIAIAGREGDLRALETAIAMGGEIDCPVVGHSGLHFAIIYGHVQAALKLLEKGANPNLRNHLGETPLYLCAASNSLDDMQSSEVAEALLRNGADPKLVTSAGDTVASLAENRGKRAMLRVLGTSGTST